jgi:hypothetical protein
MFRITLRATRIVGKWLPRGMVPWAAIVVSTISFAAATGSEERISTEVFAKAQRNGSVRIIVELKLLTNFDGADDSRENAIRATQSAVFSELAGVNYRIIRTYKATPAIVLQASPAALQIIAASPNVLRVFEDRLSFPSKEGG